MPQQFYLTGDPAPYIPGVWMGGWNKTTDAVDRQLDSTKTTADPTKYVIQSVESTEASTSPLYRVALARFVSGPLIAQLISGTMQLMAGVRASNIAAELYYSVHLWATQGDTDLIRATLIDQFSELATSLNPFPADPKGRDLILSAAIDAGTIMDNDRLVLEVGYIARNISGTAYAGGLYYSTDFYSNGTIDMFRDA